MTELRIPAPRSASKNGLGTESRFQDGMATHKQSSLQRSPKRLALDPTGVRLSQSPRDSKKLKLDAYGVKGLEPPDPLDADPLALMASQSHLLHGPQLSHMQRGNSSSVRDLDRLPTPNVAELEVGLPEAVGSSGEAKELEVPNGRADRALQDEGSPQQQLQQLKKTHDAAKAQHRLQLQERNRQIGHLQEDREKLRRLLKKAEGDVRDAQDQVLCTVCQKVNRNCLILPCLHYLLCAGCLQQHTSTCPFCPACKTKVSGLLVVLTSI